MEASAAHDEFRTGRAAAEIDEQIDPLGWREHHIGARFRFLEKPAVHADHGKRRSIVPLQLVDSRIRRVKNAQPVGAARDVEAEIRPAVDKNLVAIEAEHARMHVVVVMKLIVAVEGAILNDERNFVFPGGQAKRAFFLVLDEDRAGKAAIDLRRRRLMRVRMIEIHARAIAHLEFVDVGFAGIDHGRRVAVHQHRDMQPVPMGDRVLGQFVAEPDANLLAFDEAHERAEIAVLRGRERVRRTFEKIADVAPDLRLAAREYGRRVAFADEFEIDVGGKAFRRPVGRDFFAAVRLAECGGDGRGARGANEKTAARKAGRTRGGHR